MPAAATPFGAIPARRPAEATLWLAASAAGGTAPVYHWLGGSPEDNRWRETGRAFYQWMASHQRHFRNTRSLAEIAVVYSQRTLCFYSGASRQGGRSDRADFFQGLYYPLLETRIPFDFVHEDDLGPETLARYRALLLPNVALMGDRQCGQIRDYVRRGGSLLATFETSLYNEWGDPRPDFGIGDVLGVNKTGSTQGPLGNSYARVEVPGHPLLGGIGPTPVLPGAVYRVPVRAPGAGRPVLTYVPPYPSHPPEMVYPRVLATDEPAVVMRQNGGGPCALLPRRYRALCPAHQQPGPRPVAPERHPMGGRRGCSSRSPGRRHPGTVRLGNRAGLGGAPAQLHQPKHAGGLGSQDLPRGTAAGGRPHPRKR